MKDFQQDAVNYQEILIEERRRLIAMHRTGGPIYNEIIAVQNLIEALDRIADDERNRSDRANSAGSPDGWGGTVPA